MSWEHLPLILYREDKLSGFVTTLGAGEVRSNRALLGWRGAMGAAFEDCVLVDGCADVTHLIGSC